MEIRDIFGWALSVSVGSKEDFKRDHNGIQFVGIAEELERIV